MENTSLLPWIYTLPTLLFVVGPFFLWLNRKIFLDLFKHVKKRYLWILLVVVIIFVILCASKGLNFRFFNASDSEWAELNVARNFLLGNKYAFKPLVDRVVSPLLLAFGLRLFGMNPLVASVLNLVLGALSIVLVFILAQIVFRDERVSIMSSLLYAFTSYTFVFTAVRMGDPTTVGFFMLLFAISTILAFRHHHFNLHILALICFVLTSQVKLEYFVLIFPYIICFMLFKEYRYLSLKKILVLVVLFCVLSAPFFISNSHFKSSTESGWCGNPSQTFHNGKIYSYALPLLDPLNKSLKFLANGRFSFNYLFYDIPNFISFWFSRRMALLSLAVLGGILLSFKKHKKENTFLLSSFLLMTTVYLADCIYYETRLAVPSYNLIVIYSGLFLVLLYDFLGKTFQSHKQKLTKYIPGVVLLLILFLLYYFNWSLSLLNNSRGNYRDLSLLNQRIVQVNITDTYNQLKNILISYDLSRDSSNLIVPHHSEKDVLTFDGYQAYCLTNLVDYNYFKNHNAYFDTFNLPLDTSRDNYFIESPHCYCLEETQEVCNFVKEHYVQDKVGEKGLYTLYKLKNKL